MVDAQEELELLIQKCNHPGLLPPDMEGWFFSVPPPQECRTGLFPYPLVIKGPIPRRRLSADRKTCIILTTFLHHDADIGVWEHERTFLQKINGLGPFATQRTIVTNVGTSETGLYMVKSLICVRDETNGEIIQRAMACSDPFEVLQDYDNTSIQRSKTTVNPATWLC